MATIESLIGYLKEDYRKNKREILWFLFFLSPVFIFAVLIVMPIYPVDDLNRHFAWHLHDGEYRDIYPYVSEHLRPYSHYFSFDWAVGYLYDWTHDVTHRFPFIALYFITIIVFLTLVLRLRYQLDGSIFSLIILIALITSPLFARVSSSRPELFLSLWALFAATVRTKSGLGLWIMSGAIVSTGYWLSPIYNGAVALLYPRFGLKVVFISGVALTGAQIGFWLWFTEGGYFSDMSNVFSLAHLRTEDFQISELRSGLGAFFVPAGPHYLLLAALAILAFIDRLKVDKASLGWFAFALSFLIHDLARYNGIIYFALIMGFAVQLRDTRIVRFFNENFALAFLLSFSLITAQYMPSQKNEIHRNLDYGLYVPESPIILTTLAIGPAIVYDNPTFKVIPTFDPIWNSDDAKRLMLPLYGKPLPEEWCEDLKNLEIDFIVEEQFSMRPKECLELISMRNKTRVWRVK